MKIENFNKTQFDSYAAYLKSTGLSDASLKRKLSSLANFQRYLIKKGYQTLLSSGHPPLIKGGNSNSAAPLNQGELSNGVRLKGFDFKKLFSKSTINNLKSKPLTTYLIITSLLIISSAIGYGFYRQSVKDAKSGFAYSTASNPVYANRFLSFQGRLTDSSGNPITSETDILFELYNTPDVGTGTTLYTSATGNSQTVTFENEENGIFSVTIGKSHGTTIPNTVFTENSAVYLQITAGSEIMSPRQPIATVAYAINAETLQGMPPSASGLKNTVLTIGASGNINLGETSPSIISTSGTFGIEGQAVLIKASDSSGGNVEINPDANGIIKLTTEGSGSTDGIGLINATNASLSTGNLFNASINNTSRGYNFINFNNFDENTTNLSSRFSVDAYGNTFIGGTLSPTTISIGNTILTSTASELNLLDGTQATAGSLIYGNGSNLVNTSVGTSGQLLMSNSTGAPVWINANAVGTTYAATNGLTLSSNTFKLGGALTENTRLNIGNTEVLNIDFATSNITIGDSNTGTLSLNSQNTILRGLSGNIISSNNLLTSLQELDTRLYNQQNTTKEMTGFVNRTDSTLSFIDVGRTFTITGTNFKVYSAGKEYIKNIESTTIPNTVGLHYIYYDKTDGSLKTSTNSWSTTDGTIQIATVYWNGTNGLVGDERHGLIMDGMTHEFLHNTVGTRYSSGLGATFANGTFSINDGTVYDEDIKIDIGATNVTRILYKNGSADFTFTDIGTSYYYGVGGTALAYNNGNVLTPVPSGQYVAYWIFATNDPTTPIYSLMGQRVDTNLTNAQNNAKYESLVLGNLPFKEMKLLYRVILRNVASPYIQTLDLRNVSNLPAGTYVATAHNTLGGLTSGDDHTQYALLAGRTTGQTLIGSIDTDTGLVLQSTSGVGTTGADIKFKVGNNGDLEAMTILNSGLVGIGTTNPTSKLHVIGDGYFSTNLTIGGTLTLTQGKNAGYILQSDANGNASWVSASGVGIGTTYAAGSGLTLSSNTFKLGGALTENTRLNIGDTEVFYGQYSNGYVGIGTTNPTSKVQISDNLNTTLTLSDKTSYYDDFLSGPRILLENSVGPQALISSESNAVNQGGKLHLQTYSNSSGDLNDGITITKTGQVGIGTQNPSQSLTVVGDGYFSTNLTIGGTFVSVGSTNLVSSLNADLLDGLHSSSFLSVGSTGSLPYVNDVTDSTLTRTGTGPYTLSLNLGSTNVWTALTTFTNGIGVSGDVNLTNNLTIGGTFVSVGSTNLVTNLNTNYLNGIASSGFVGVGSTGNFITTLTNGVGISIVGTGVGRTIAVDYDATKLSLTGNKLTLNLGATNVWTALQTFTNGIGVSGTTNLTNNLNVGGTLALTQGASDGYVLTSDASGNARWAASAGVGTTYAAGSGLTLSSGTFKLGGALTENTRLNIGDTEVFYAQYSTGNVGIGTTNPIAKLEVIGDSYGSQISESIGTSSSFTVSGIAQTWNDDDAIFSYTLPFSFPYFGVGVSDVQVSTNGVLWMCPSCGSNSSLSDSSQIPNQKAIALLWADLITNGSSQTNEDIYIDTSVSNEVTFTWKAETLSDGVITNFSLTLKSDGKITLKYDTSTVDGISENLIAISNGDGTNYKILSFSGTSSTTDLYDTQITYSDISASPVLPIFAANTPAKSDIFTILNNGNVGIGTTSPSQKLNVVGNGFFSGNLNVGQTGSFGNLRIGTTEDDLYTGLLVNNHATIDNININQNEIYSSSSDLILTGGGSSTTRNYINLGNNAGGISLKADTSSAQNITLDARSNGGFILLNGGNVGIGITNPTSKLHVVGDANITTNLTVGGTLTLSQGATDGYVLTSDASGHAYWALSTGGVGTTYTAGSGLTLSSNTFSLNLGSTNVWTALTTFTNGIGVSGDVNLTNNLTIGGTFVSVGSTNLVTNLNADLLDGYQASSFIYTASNGITLATNDFQLGGSLTKNTEINILGFNLSFLANTRTPTQSLFLSTTGTVGIGTTNPTSKLTVVGDANISTNLTIGGTFVSVGSTNLVTNLNANYLNGLAYNNLPYVNDVTDSTLTRTGTGPYTLGLNLGSTNVWTALQTFTNGIGVSGTTNLTNALNVGGTAYFADNVGIGTTNPTSKLHVVGDANITTNLTIGGTLAVTGQATFATGIGVTGDSVFSNNLTIGGTFVSVGSTNLVTNLNANYLNGLAYNNLPYVNDVTDSTLTRTGTGPYTLGLNLGSTNVWTALQTFTNGIGVSGTTNLTNALNVGGTAYFADNVGIGTTDPLSPLHVGTTTSASVGGQTLTNLSGLFTGSIAAPRFYDSDNPLYFFDPAVNDANYNSLGLATQGSIKFNVTDTTGASKYIGAYAASRLQGFTNGLSFDTGTAASIGVGNTVVWNNNLFLATTGYVGIGTTNPIGPFQLNIGDTQAFLISSSGNVGIGTTNPTAKLSIGGASSLISNASGDITLNAASDNISFAGDSLINVNNAYFAGNVGIGTTSPDQKLELSGGGLQLNDGYGIGFIGELPYSNIGSSQTTDGARIYYDGNAFGSFTDGLIIEKTDLNNISPDGKIGFSSIGADGTRTFNMVINGSGEVGIGTTNPLRILDIGTSWIRMTPIVLTSGTLPATQFVNSGDFAVGSVGTTASSGRIWLRSNATNYRFQSFTNTGDYSEYFYSGQATETGDLMIVDNQTSPYSDTGKTTKSTQPYQSKILGVVTDMNRGTSFNNPNDDRHEKPEFANVGLLGHVYTKVCTENGDINPGDPLTSSSISGVAMKATKASQIVGYATENYSNSNSTSIKKIMVYVNPSYYDPDINLTSTGQININYNISDEVLASLGYSDSKNEIESATYSIKDSLGNTVTKIAQFTEITAAKIKAGLISTTNLIANNAIIDQLKANKLNTNELVSPVGNITHLTSQDIQTTTVTTNNLVASDIQTTQVTTDNLIAENIETQHLVSNNLTSREATVSTLYTDQIISKEGSFTDIMANKISSLRDELTQIVSNNESESTPSAILAESNNWSIAVATNSATISGNLALTDNLIIGAQLMVKGDSQFGNAFVTGQFTAGEVSIASNYIETSNTALFIQPSNTGSVHIMGETLVIADTGEVKINGNLTVTGSVFANLLEANEIKTQKLTAAEINSDKINISTDLSAIASASAESGMIIADNNNINIATNSAQINSNATAGTATLPTGKTELIISTTKLTANSMVYLTPIGSTNNQVVFVKSKYTCDKNNPELVEGSVCKNSFTIALDNPLTQDIQVNWWIIN